MGVATGMFGSDRDGAIGSTNDDTFVIEGI
jgi:hypothetical protein